MGSQASAAPRDRGDGPVRDPSPISYKFAYLCKT